MNGTCAAGTDYKRVVCKEDKDCGEGTNGVCGPCNGLTGERVCGAAESLDDCSAVWKRAMSCYESKAVRLSQARRRPRAHRRTARQ